MTKESLWQLTGTVALNGARFARELVVLKLLVAQPDLRALWIGVSVVRQYGAFSDFGLSNALVRLLPESLAKGDTYRSTGLVATSWAGSMVSTVLLTLLLSAVMATIGLGGTTLALAPLVLLVLLLDKQVLISQSTLRSEGNWPLASVQNTVLGILECGLALWGCIVGQIYGALVGTAVALLIVSLAFWRTPKTRVTLSVDKLLLSPLLRLGIVMSGYGLANIAIHNIDRLAVLVVAPGHPSLPAYHVAGYATMAMSLVAGGVMAVYVTRLYRHSESERGDFGEALGFPTFCVTTLAAFVGGSVLGLMALLLPLVSDKAAFSPMIVAVLVVTEIVFCWTMPAESALVGMGLGQRTVWIRLIGIAATFIGSVVSMKQGFGILGVALSRLLAQTLVSFIVMVVASTVTKTKFRIPVIAVAAPLAWTFVAGFVTHLATGLPDPNGPLAKTIVSCCLLCLLLLPLAIVVGSPSLRSAASGIAKRLALE